MSHVLFDDGFSSYAQDVEVISMDPTKRETGNVKETKQQYHLNELSEMLNASVEKVRVWLQDEGVEPVSNDEPEMYEAEAYEVLRGRKHQV